MPTLYLIQPGTRLELEAGQLLCSDARHVLLSVPYAQVSLVVVVGGCNVTTPALALLLDRGVDVVFVSRSGRFRGRLDTGHTSSIDVRRQQYRRADDPLFCLQMSKAFVQGKISNSRTRCMELDKGDDVIASNAIQKFKESLGKVETARDITSLMGIEGRAARWYFAELSRNLRPPWSFTARRRRPPPDPVNAVLSITYTLLHEQCRTSLYIAGLDPDCGFYHQSSNGRSSLALDFMEEFRPVIADSVAWGVFNRQMLSPADFTNRGTTEGVYLSPAGWRCVAVQFERRLDSGIMVPGRRTRTTYRKLLEVQARQLARVIAGEREIYEPFLSR